MPVISARLPAMVGGRLSGRLRGGPRGHLLAHPVDRAGDALTQLHLRLPFQQPARLLHRGPAPLDVDLEALEVLELELLDGAFAGLPDDSGDLGDRELFGGGDVEVLALSGR